MNYKSTAFLLLLLLAAFTSAAATSSLAAANTSSSTVSESHDVKIINSEFGIFNLGPDGKPVSFTPTKQVPLVVGQPYGWVIYVQPKTQKIRVREEFTLPEAPEIWGGEPEGTQSLSSDRKVSVIEREADASGGIVTNAWEVAPGDPSGKYRIKVFFNDRLAATFEFIVKEPEKKD